MSNFLHLDEVIIVMARNHGAEIAKAEEAIKKLAVLEDTGMINRSPAYGYDTFTPKSQRSSHINSEQIDHTKAGQHLDTNSHDFARTGLYAGAPTPLRLCIDALSDIQDTKPFPSERERLLAQRGVELGIHSGVKEKKGMTNAERFEAARKMWLAKREAELDELRKVIAAGGAKEDGAVLDLAENYIPVKTGGAKAFWTDGDRQVHEESWETLMEGFGGR